MSLHKFRIVLVAILLPWFAVQSASAADNEAVGAEVAAIFASDKVETGSEAANAAIENVRAYYKTRSFKPVWTRDSGPKGKAKALLAELKTSAVHALSPQFYNVPEIERLMPSTDPKSLARLDLLLTGSFVDFAGDLRNGRLGPGTPGAYNSVEPVGIDPYELIEGAADAGNLRQFASQYLNADKRYVRLISKLAELLRLEASGEWPELPAGNMPIAAGASDERLPAIRKQLFLSGDLPLDALERGTVHDETSVPAVKRFQERHGLAVSGDIDMSTLEELAVPLDERIRQIRVNLERRRWQNRDLEDDHLYLNLADNNIKLVLDGVTVGTYEIGHVDALHEMPSFFGEVTAITAGDGAPVLAVSSDFVDRLADRTRPGAIGVIEIAALADALRKAKGASTDDASGTVKFAKPLTLYVTYVTAWATGDGGLYFRRDRFGRDTNLAELLELGD